MDRLFIIDYLNELSTIMKEKQEYLIELDSVVGDGDLGLTMSDGFEAAFEAIKTSEENDLGRLLFTAGKAMSSAVPSTMGTLMASGFMQAGKAFKGKDVIEAKEIVDLLRAYAEGVMHRGKAQPGEKTFIDGLMPAIKKMDEAFAQGLDAFTAAKKGVSGAVEGYDRTAGMLAVHGRAATRGEASRTLKDPGAAVAVLMITALEKSTRNFNHKK
ncbi:DAK2 domain-containing protein [Enterococcus florum]|uniref:phosphoenolpyruvate--glycerone phosphotransferase n=1 Tax=Enterococcus florum TaxID=2480627 RepID=A0A4P5PB24_9ENTE|nr:dihydroxyacetone kinase subunit L [Enterococcus florum]GCF93481.1 DAK2 domain-containing protein [Enterococcus florum]